MEETYEVDVECENCGAGGTMDIPKGVDAWAVIEDSECPYCELGMLIKAFAE